MDELDDPKDRLIDTLLREALGKESPPNLANRILQRVDRDRRRFYWLAGGLSAAAAIALAFAVWKFALPAPAPQEVAHEPEKAKDPDLKWEQQPYAPPKPEPDLKPSAGEWARGGRIKTDDKSRRLELGGYCKLEAAPHSALLNEGKDKAEQVFLESGSVTCQVDKHIGTFAVRTDSGTVAVTGTKFSVGISGEGNDLKTEHAQRRVMAVSVQEGAVELAGWATTLHGGEKGGVDFGVVVNKGDSFIEIKDESSNEARRYTPRTRDGVDKSMLELFHRLSKGSRVQVAWIQQEYPRATKIQVLWAKPEAEQHHRGTVTGVITEKGGGEWIRVKSEGENERYTPRWIASKEHPNEGNLDRDTARALEKLNVGDKVRIEWMLEEHRRIVHVEKLEKE